MKENGKINELIALGKESQIRDLAEELEDYYHLSEKLELDDWQRELFNLHMMGYLILKTNSEAVYILRRPETEIMRKIPIIKNMVAAIENDEKTKQKIAKDLFDRASSIAKEMRESAHEVTIEFVAKKGGFTIEDVKTNLEPDNEVLNQLVDTILRGTGSPTAIKNAANLITSAFVNSKDKPTAEQERIMQATLSRIKIRG